MQINNTGTNNTKLLTIPKGKIYFSELSSGDVLSGWRFAGNAPEMSITMDIETYEHFSSQEGIKTKDLEILTSRDLNVTFKLEEMNADNISKFFSGTHVTVTNPAVAGITDEVLVVAGNIATGMYYDVMDEDGVRLMDLTPANVTIKTSNAIPVTLVVDEDYTLDAAMGVVYLIPGSTKLATAISGLEGLTVTVTATAAAKAVLQTTIFTKDQTIVAVKWVSVNANSRDGAVSNPVEYFFPKVTLTSDQALNLVATEVISMGFKGSCVSSSVYSKPLVVRTVSNV